MFLKVLPAPKTPGRLTSNQIKTECMVLFLNIRRDSKSTLSLRFQ